MIFKKILLSLLILGVSLQATPPTKATVARLYLATFDRAPDSAGLSYWLYDSKLELEDIAKSLFDQLETKERYPDALSLDDFIQAIYQNLFGRGADSGGFEYWHKELDSSSVGRDKFILALINGALGDDAKLLANKLTVALAFVDDGRDDIDEAHKILLLVTGDISTVDNVLCEHTLRGCYVAPKSEDSSESEDSNTDEDTTDSSGSSGGSAGDATPPPPNTKPVANAGDDKVDVVINIPEAINGTGSDDDGDNLTYKWSIKDTSPTGASIADTTNKDTTFTATQAGVYTLSLVVNDGTEDSDEDTMTITVTPPSTLKKTGQTTSYYSKDDGDYQVGVAHSYTNNGDGTVTDNVTGFIWQDNEDVKTVTKKYENSDDSSDTAFTYCTTLTLGGYDDWRLPTTNELFYITDKGKYNTAIDTRKFLNVASSDYWSATGYASGTSYAWVVSFDGGNDYWNSKGSSSYVRCVRGDSTIQADRFSRDDTTNIVTDSLTNLQWQDEPYTQVEEDAYTQDDGTEEGKVLQWENAISYCENLTLGEKSDWRLPNYTELKSLVDRDYYSPAIYSSFLNIASSRYWSTTSIASDTSYVWVVNFYYGNDYGCSKGSSCYVRCVRAG